VIPKAIRDEIGIQPGDEVTFEPDGSEARVRRIESGWLESGAAISSINLGEVLYIRTRAIGEDSARADVETIRRRLTLVEPDWSLVTAAATIKANGGLALALAGVVVLSAFGDLVEVVALLSYAELAYREHHSLRPRRRRSAPLS
jgi:bifunctional DNA-binding transcriptional regulator/antitoxin component of YhaV-PrlF toxin-antitoxin module